MHTVIIDYESGNLHSAFKAFQRMADVGDKVSLSSVPEDIVKADRIVLPGDGAFMACKAALHTRNGLNEALQEAVCDKGRPFMGICVGMQLMASVGFEPEETAGLGWIKGSVKPLCPDDAGLKIPHMGWNNLIIRYSHPVLADIQQNGHAYFIHSYAVSVEENHECLAFTEYGQEISAVIGRGNMIGTQFHPEKSHNLGLRIITNFLKWFP